MISFVLAPVEANIVAAKCHRSWKRTHSRPTLFRAASQMTQKLLGRSRSARRSVEEGSVALRADEALQELILEDGHDGARHEDRIQDAGQAAPA